jgi:UDP-glucose 4-epimerase
VYHEGSILDEKLLDEVFANSKYVFHLAALPRVQFSIEHPKETNAVNVDGTLAVLEAAREARVQRVVFSTSSAVYGNQEVQPLVETMGDHPLSPYALHKYIGEEYCRLYAEVYGLQTVSLRYANAYGPHADPVGPYALALARFILQRQNGEPLTIAGDGTNTRDYVHVRDVARANLLAATSENVGKGEVINIGTGESHSVNELAALVGGSITSIPERLEVKHTTMDISRAKELLNWEPTIKFEEGVAELKKEANLT